MRRCIAIGGVPGTGKTTLMREFLPSIPESKDFRKLVKGHEFENYIVLGDYSDFSKTFSGTDVFSMSVQPEAEAFFKENEKNVVFEGDRIFNQKMLNFINDNGYDLLIIILEADENMLKKRYEERGSDQSEKFINGRKTKYENVKNNGAIPVYTAKHETEEDTKKIVEAMNAFLESGKIRSDILEKVEVNSLENFFS